MSTTERTVEVLATAASIFVSGIITSISMVTIPSLLSTFTTNDALLQQWKTIYDRGSKQGPIMAGLAGLTHGGIAYLKWTRGQDPTSSVLAAIFTIGIVPFTGAVMLPTNNQLMRGVKKREKQENARALVDKWMWFNGMRGLLPLIGGVFGLLGIAR